MEHWPKSTASLLNAISSARTEELLQSNQVPSDAERETVESVLHRSEAFFSDIAARIEMHTAALEALDLEEEKAIILFAQYRKIINPIRALPDDVLLEIFVHATSPPQVEDFDMITGDHEDARIDALDIHNPSWTLSFVCSSWRRLVLSTSRFWTCLRFRFQSYTNPFAKSIALTTVLMRSQSRLLDITLQSTENLDDNPILAVLLSTAPRWRSLTLSIPYRSLIAFQYARGLFTSLERLVVPELQRIPGDVAPSSPLGATPLLKQIIHGGIPITIADVLQYSLSTVTTFLGVQMPQQAIRTLRRAKKLEKLQVVLLADTFGSAAEVFESLQVMQHENLKYLGIWEAVDCGRVPDSESATPAIFETHRFPSLQTFVLTHVGEPRLDGTLVDGPVICNLPKFHHDTAPNLTLLSLRFNSIPFDYRAQSAIHAIVQMTPQLRELYIAADFTSGTLFRCFTWAKRWPDYLAHLEALSLAESEIDWTDEDLLSPYVKMVDSWERLSHTVNGGRGYPAIGFSAETLAALKREKAWLENGRRRRTDLSEIGYVSIIL